MTSAPAPRRRPSPAVYRRRRAVALLLLLVVVVGIVLVVWRPWSGSSDSPVAAPTPTETPLPTIYPSTTPAAETATPTPTGPAACTAADVVVTAVTDATNYAAASVPQLSLTLQNTGTADCVMNAGTSQQVFTITSGNDTYWTSTDCQTDASDQEILLTAGSTVSGSPIAWDRTRSSPDTCSGGREAVPAGGASYYLTVTVSGIASEAHQFLLN